eukprot:g2122.t1
MDVRRLPEKRMHDDVFEGILTRSVNAQLITDAHRAEWAIEGNGFIVPKAESDEEPGLMGETGSMKQLIADFGAGLVTALEEFLLSFCERRQLSVRGTEHVIQAVTTQMSQCGLANLDRCSRVGQYMVGGARLKQHVNYNISCMDAGPLGDALTQGMHSLATVAGSEGRASAEAFTCCVMS